MLGWIVPLTVAVPLTMAAALALLGAHLPRTFVDILSTATGVAVTGLCALLLVRSAPAPVVYAFGGWGPRHGIVLGILFVVDPIGAGLATLVAALVTASLLFSWRYFEEVKSLFHVLILVFLGGWSALR